MINALSPAFRKLEMSEIERIYEADMRLQFPGAELRPLSGIIALYKVDKYEGYALFHGHEICCYALVAGRRGSGGVLLDYLATPDGWKNKGLGGEMLMRLRSEYGKTDPILIESEEPDSLTDAEREMSLRRLGFYKRNGFFETGVRLLLFGVQYRVLAEALCGKDAFYAVRNVYASTLPKVLFEKHVRLSLACAE